MKIELDIVSIGQTWKPGERPTNTLVASLYGHSFTIPLTDGMAQAVMEACVRQETGRTAPESSQDDSGELPEDMGLRDDMDPPAGPVQPREVLLEPTPQATRLGGLRDRARGRAPIPARLAPQVVHLKNDDDPFPAG